MVYPHAVIYDGILYPAGAEIPEPKREIPEPAEKAESQKPSRKKAVGKRADKRTA